MSGTFTIGNKQIFSHSDATDVVTLENTTLSNTVLGLPTIPAIPTQVYAFGRGTNNYDGSNNVKYNEYRISNGITFGPSDSSDATNFVPPSTGYYHISVGVIFWNEPPSGNEDDSGTIRLDWQDSGIEYFQFQFKVTSSPTTSHEANGFGASVIYQVTSTGGATDYFNLKHIGFNNLGLFNETYRVTIFKLS